MKELNEFEIKLLEKMITGNKKGIPITKFLESQEFKDSILSLLDFEKINGKDVLTIKSKEQIKEIDPIDLIERFTGERINESNIGGSIMVSMVKKALIDIIAENTYDIANTYSASYNEYIDLFKSYGFENMLEIKYKRKEEDAMFESVEEMEAYFDKKITTILNKKEVDDRIYCDYEMEETEFFLFNKERGLLIHGETYNNRVNSINLVANIEIKKGSEFNNYSGGSILGTNKQSITMDLRQLPGSVLEEVYSKTISVKEYLKFDYKFYSYLSHKDVEVGDLDWNKIQAQKISQFPKDIIEQLLSKNIEIQLLKDVNKYLHTDKKIEEKNKEEKNFMYELSERYIKELQVRYDIFAFKNNIFVSKELNNHIINNNLDPKICADYCSYAFRKKTISELDYDDCIDILSRFNKEELMVAQKSISTLLINKDDNKKLIDYVEERLEFLNQPSNQKGSKRKLN